jgi:hypothetical protein
MFLEDYRVKRNQKKSRQSNYNTDNHLEIIDLNLIISSSVAL